MSRRIPLLAGILFLLLVWLAGQPSTSASPPPSSLPLSQPAAGPSITVCLRQDVSGYRGTDDADINRYSESLNTGSDPSLRVASDGSRRALIRFQMPSLPADITITQAVLRLYVAYASTPAYPMQVRLFRIHKMWLESDVTWREAVMAQPWELPGCDHVPLDRAGTPSAQGQMDSAGQWLAFDLTSDVTAWRNDPTANHGVILIGAGDHTIQYNLASSEYPQLSYRPELCITYLEATPTPTVTPTGTPTHTPTPTRTFTPTPTVTTTPTRNAGDIYGMVWHDINGNRLRDHDEPPLPNAQIILRTPAGALMMLQTTGGDGLYRMENIVPGVYWLQESDPPGYISTTPNDWMVPVFANTSIEVNFGDRLAPTPTPTSTATPTSTPTVTPVPCRDAYEPDDTPAQARAISTLATPQHHNIHAAGDIDYVKFTAFAGSTYLIRTASLGGGLINDTRLRLLAPDGVTILAENDDDPTNPPASAIQWICPASGVYFAAVSQFNPAVGGCDITYDILVREITPAPSPTPTATPTRGAQRACLPLIWRQ